MSPADASPLLHKGDARHSSAAPGKGTPLALFKPKPAPPSPVPGLPGFVRLEHLAWLMDRAFRIPGTNIRVGLDSILGLLPVGGDAATGLIQVGLVLVALIRYRVPRSIAARMAANVLLDMTIGAVPLLGDLFDVAFKANTRNIQLLQQVEDQRRRQEAVSTRGSILFLVGVAVVLVSTLALVCIGFVAVVAWLINRPWF